MKIEKCFGCQIYSRYLEYKISVGDPGVKFAEYCTLYRVYLYNDSICPCATCIVKITCQPDTICPNLTKEKYKYNLT